MLMRVLHIPFNIASQISVSVRALKSIGVHPRGIVLDAHVIQRSEGVQQLQTNGLNGAKRFGNFGKRVFTIFSTIQWADVVHWHFGSTALPKKIDLRWIRALRKPSLVEFWGSDIRIAEIEARDNPYYAKAQQLGQYPYADSHFGSTASQACFAKAGMACLLPCHSLLPYVQPGLFKKIYFTRQRIFLPDFLPVYPQPMKRRPLVVHSPSNPRVKGTEAVRAAIRQLAKRFEFDYLEQTNVPHEQAMIMVQQCDVFLDQFILGSHGLAALEAMAYGKPVVCYIKPSMVDKYPSELPIVNASQDTLVEVLGTLLADGNLRNNLGRKGRAYVETYHDAIKIAYQLKDIYTDLIMRKKRMQ